MAVDLTPAREDVRRRLRPSLGLRNAAWLEPSSALVADAVGERAAEGYVDRAAFLDKDGTLLVDVAYNVDPAKMRFAPGAADGLRSLAGAGFRLVVVSNQSGVARGLFEEEALVPVRDRLAAMFEHEGVELAGFYYCPHHPDGIVPEYRMRCACRKPASGLIARASTELGIDPRESWMIGDTLDDIEAGTRVGCRTVHVDNGGETVWKPGALRRPDATVPDFFSAAAVIVAAAAKAAAKGAV